MRQPVIRQTLFRVLIAVAVIAPTGAPSAVPLSWTSNSVYRCAPVQPSSSGTAGFTQLAPGQTGISFSNLLSMATIATNRLYEIGSGVALGDVDGDGWTDIYFCGLESANALYRNLGDWKFEDITAAAGVACPDQFSTGCVLVDLDGDGDLDLLVNSLGGGSRLFANDGVAHFTERTDLGLIRRFGATSAALADIEGDGDLDLYVTHYRTDTFLDFPRGLRIEMRQQPDGTRALEPKERFLTVQNASGVPTVLERGEPDILYVNRGGGRMTPIPWNTGLFLDENGLALKESPTDWGLSVMFRDLNGDRLPDLYVCNDFVAWPDRIWLNDGGRRFRAAPHTALRSVSLASMAVDVADINRDGYDDLWTADMLSPIRARRAWQRPDILRESIAWPIANPDFRPEVPRNTLQLSRGDGTYAEIAQLAGVAATDWTPAAAFLDVDLDGWEDLLTTAGNLHDVQDADALAAIGPGGRAPNPATRLENLARMPSRLAPSLAFRNRHDLTFEDVSAAWGFHDTGVGHGLAFGDLDQDGDLDVVVNAMNAPARLYRNDAGAPRVAVRLHGLPANTRGVGATITVRGGPVTQSQQIIAGGRFESSDDAMRVFAAGDARELEIEVLWRDGKHSRVSPARPNFIYEIIESVESSPSPAAPTAVAREGESARPGEGGSPRVGTEQAMSDRPGAAPLFDEFTPRLAHVHVDSVFNDFLRHPLLPRKLSTLGPGIGCADVDGDGDDDLFIAGGRNGRLVLFSNDGRGKFTEAVGVSLPKSNPRDQTALIYLRDSDGGRLLVGQANWEDEDTNAPAFQVFALRPAAPAPPNPAPPLSSGLNSTGPLAVADVDGDGDLDLFIGGRVVAGRYPEPPDSGLFLADGHGSFARGQVLRALGLVTGALFSDIDGDGDPDLILACEWDSIRVLRNDRGSLVEATSELGLANLKGWWNGVAGGDFDGDGRVDLVASNWGRNCRSDQPGGAQLPVRLYYGEFAANHRLETLMASMDPALAKMTPWRERSAVIAEIPAVAARCVDHHHYGAAGIQEILGDTFATARVLEATSLDSMVFLNRGDHFEARPLPIEAQFSTAFGVSVADFDGDGHEDVFLAQNFFGVDPENSRQDAGTGLVLLGDGLGGFHALRPRESGIALFGEQRGSAVGDLDGDGRTDLAVAQQGAPARVFRNIGGRRGVHVRLRGPPGNPDAIGAVARLRFANQFGPAREIHAGSGYWSQDSSRQVMGAPAPPSGLEVRWPGGKIQEWSWPEGAWGVTASPDGLQRE